MAKANIATIDADLQKRAENMRERIGSPESRKITVDQKDGVLLGPGGLDLGVKANIIVVDFCNTNKFYDRKYSADNKFPPACFAYGDTIKDMVPEDYAPDIQNEQCGVPNKEGCCWANEWGSDPGGGKGKACQNKRHLAVVFSDELEDPSAEPEMYLIEVSPTSVKSFDAAAGAIYRETNGMPPIKKIMTVEVVQTANYFNLRFGVGDDNPYVERVYPLMDRSADLLAPTIDVSGWEPLPTPKTKKR